MDFYKGYILTSNKKALEKRKGRSSFLQLEEVQDAPEYAGVLANGIVLVDFDDPEQAETALQIVKDQNTPCTAIKTKRGIHMLFTSDKPIKEKTHCKIACGLTADFKMGSSSNSYEVLKYEGVQRKIILDNGISNLPYYFQQITGFDGDLWKMKAGDGRNEALYSYEIDCVRAGFLPDQIRSLFGIINNYVFADKLSDSELNTITREEAFSKIFADKKMHPTTIADIMIAQDHVIRIGEQLFMYQGSGVYTAKKHDVERRMLSYVPKFNTNQRKEVLNFLQLQAPEKAISDKRYISFKNGVFDLKTDSYMPHSPNYIIPNQIPWNYNPAASFGDLGKAMKDAIYSWACDDEEIVALLEELIGYSMYRENTFRKFFVLVGNKRNGKSKFLDVIRKMIGEENTSSVPLEKLDERFQNSSIKGKLLNVGDDIEGAKVIEKTAALKKFVSGDLVEIESKYKNTVECVPYATLVFSANKIPRIEDPTGAVKDRMIIIPFNAHFEEGAENNNPDIVKTLTTDENMEYMIRIGIQGLKRLLKNGRFTIPECVKASMKEYMLESDTISAFVEEYKGSYVGEGAADVYASYERFCKEYDVLKESRTKFTQTIKRQLHLRTQSEHGRIVYRPMK